MQIIVIDFKLSDHHEKALSVTIAMCFPWIQKLDWQWGQRSIRKSQ